LQAGLIYLRGNSRDYGKSSSGGTGFPACADRLAGGDARPTNLFMLYRWAIRPINDCLGD